MFFLIESATSGDIHVAAIALWQPARRKRIEAVKNVSHFNVDARNIADLAMVTPRGTVLFKYQSLHGSWLLHSW